VQTLGQWRDWLGTQIGRLDPENPYQNRIRHWLSWDPWIGHLGPDAHRYMVAHERNVARPFHYRWLTPRICQGDRRRFALIGHGSLAAMIPAMRWYTGRWSPGLFLFGLPGVWDTARYCPPLVDAPAMALAVLSAAAVKQGQWGLGIVLSLAAGATKETAPLFAALYAWNPAPLIGLGAPALRHLQPAGDDVFGPDEFPHYVLDHPFETAWSTRQGRSKDWKLWLAPWGACLAGFGNPTPQTLATLAAAYGQCIGATDNARLYQWAWPVMADNTVKAAGSWWLVALIAHLLNPWKGDGE
jgi:hypothetical protein